MKIKTWLYPLVLIVSTLAVAVALIFPIYNLVYKAGMIDELLASFGVFTNFMGVDAFPTYVGITGIFASSYLILGFVGLLMSVVLTILKMTGFEIKNYALCNRISAGVALVGTIGFVVSAITFLCINQYDMSYVMPDAFKAFTGTFALWMAMGGLILGTIASYLGAIDIAHEEKKAEKPEIAVTANVVEEKTETNIVATKKPAVAKKAQAKKPQTKKPQTKKPQAKKVEVKTETKKAEAKPAVVKKAEVKKQTKKAEPAKVETKKTETVKEAKKVDAKQTTVKAEAKKAQAKPAVVKKAETKKTEPQTKKPQAKKVEVKAEVKQTAPAKKAQAKPATAKKVEAKKPVAKSETKKPIAKTEAKKPIAKTEPKKVEQKVAKTEVKKSTTAKKTTTKKTSKK